MIFFSVFVFTKNVLLLVFFLKLLLLSSMSFFSISLASFQCVRICARYNTFMLRFWVSPKDVHRYNTLLLRLLEKKLPCIGTIFWFCCLWLQVFKVIKTAIEAIWRRMMFCCKNLYLPLLTIFFAFFVISTFDVC